MGWSDSRRDLLRSTTVEGREVLLVREIKKGSETMTFRDAKGLPMWAGRGRR
jgi:hypothetical protein